MPDTISPAPTEKTREQVKRLVGDLDTSIPPSIMQALKALLTALDSNDPALMRSQLNAVLEIFREIVEQGIQKHLGLLQKVSDASRDILNTMKRCPRENVDDTGKMLESLFDESLEVLTEIRDKPVRWLQDRGYKVLNAAQLESAIADMQALRKRVLDGWPWSSLELPPVDRKMVAESKAAMGRDEGERVEDLIRRLGGVPSKED